MIPAHNIELCEGIAKAMLSRLDHASQADNKMLTHAVRDLANLCADLQRQIEELRL